MVEVNALQMQTGLAAVKKSPKIGVMADKKHKKKKSSSFKWGFFSGLLFFGALLFAVNFVYQVYRNPAALLGAGEFGKAKTIKQTWASYRSDFYENSTEIMTPKYLAALAQVESAGNPWVTQNWKIKWNRGFKGLYAPISSSVGLYQFTTPTFEWAKKYCIHNGKVQTEGPWYQVNRCWFNSLYTRFLPSHSIEVASSYLDVQVRKLTKYQNVSDRNKRRLASIIHLCGVNKAKRFIRNGYHLPSMRYCGSHSVRNYVRKIERFERALRPL